jgi:hypothetical protein
LVAVATGAALLEAAAPAAEAAGLLGFAAAVAVVAVVAVAAVPPQAASRALPATTVAPSRNLRRDMIG